MQRLFVVAVGLLAVVGIAAPAGAAVPSVGTVSASDFVNDGCAAGTNAMVFTATLTGTYPVTTNSAALGALTLRAFHSCDGVLGAVTLAGATMPGTAVAPSCVGTRLTRNGANTFSVSASCQSGSLRFRVSLITVRDVLSAVNSFTVNHGLIGLPGYLGVYTISVG